ncbi:unnamed protein product [Cutaneotrichosporon oleaginosum]
MAGERAGGDNLGHRKVDDVSLSDCGAVEWRPPHACSPLLSSGDPRRCASAEGWTIPDRVPRSSSVISAPASQGDRTEVGIGVPGSGYSTTTDTQMRRATSSASSTSIMIRNGARVLRTTRLRQLGLAVAARPRLVCSPRQLQPALHTYSSTAAAVAPTQTTAKAADPSNPLNLLTPEECEALLTAPGSPYELEMRELKAWKHTPRDFATFIRSNMERWADRELLNTPIAAPEPFEARESVTFGEAYERAATIAALLRERGIGVGDRVAVGGVNSTGWVVSCLGVQLLGAVPVLLNNGLVGESQVHCLKLTSPKFVLVDDKLAAQIGTEKIEGVGPVWCWGPTGHLSAEVQEAVTEISSMQARPQLVASVKAGEGLENLGPDSDSIVFFTSGTTSLPKGVLVTQHQALHIIHSSTYQNARTTLRLGAPVSEALKAYDPKPDGVAMLSIPLFHVQGTLTWLMVALHNGSKLVFLRHWSVPTAVKLMVEHRVGRIGGVPAIPAAILASPDLPADFELASTTYGGATPPSDLAQRLVKRWPKMLPGTGWGMTETSAFHTGFNGQEYLAKPHGAGQALPVTEIKVVDPQTRKELPAGEVGLLLARGQNLRYCARPDIVMVLDQLPWNPSQKVLKGEVKKILGAEWERVGRKPLVDSRDAKARQ